MKEKKAIVISKSCKDYWHAVKAVIDAAGDYAAAIKLRANLLDDSTYHKVEGVLKGSFAGEMSKLEDSIWHREKNFYAKVEKLNILCRQNSVHVITKPQTLLNLLLDSKKRESYRGKMQRKLQKNLICPLQDFEGKRGGQK